MSFVKISTAAAVMTMMATGASALTLNGTIRDFEQSHPDMQKSVDGNTVEGMVETTLDSDGKPVLVTPNPANSVTTKANFSQWYRDTPGVNQSKAFDITLTETAPGSGLFQYHNSSFFPIDDELFGNEGNSHNYHFTYEITGKLAFEASDSFSFTGDDDLWVFVDNKLALDLGGVKSAKTKSFNGQDLIDDLGLAENTNYAFSIFFAERHTTQSNFKITTSLPLNTTTPIPVPAALPLLVSALGGLGWISRRRKAA